VADADGDVAIGQLCLVDVLYGGTVTGVVLLNQNALEHA